MTDFTDEFRDRWTSAEEADKANRDEALLDLEFAAGEQWDERTRQDRESGEYPLPCLTINTMPQYIGQVIGDRRANASSIKVLPREDGDKEIADIRSELIRSIELQSKADRVYSQAFEQAVTCGIGNFRVDLDYAYEDAFERDLFIRGIANPLAVLWDPMAADPTGRDAHYCIVSERIRREEYKARFKAEPSSAIKDDFLTEGWVDAETVRIAEYWRIEERDKTLALQMDGKTIDITGKKPADLAGQLVINPATNEPYIRESKCKYAIRTLTNGAEELEKPFELKIPRLPIIRVMGREVWIADKRVRFGLVRFARDPQRLKNYMRSVWAQKLMQAPRHNWMAPDSAIKGRVGDYSDVLTYNDSATHAPVPMSGNHLSDFLTGAEVFAQDMKDTTGIHDASLGMRSNETSGVAIQRRQHEGDIATIVYHDNMNAAQQEAGEVCNALIPTVYDTARTIRTIGEDDAVKLLRINDPTSPDSVDLALGRYDVSISTGPAYMTKRQEASTALMQLAAQAPKLSDVAPDLIVKSLDIPDGDIIAERLKRAVDPRFLGDDERGDQDPQKAAMAAQEAAEAQEMQRNAVMLDMRLKVAQAEEAEAKARKAIIEADDAERGLTKDRIAAHGAETNRIKAITGNDFPLTPEAQAILAPLVVQAAMQVLASPDVLPLAVQQEISTAAFEDALPQPPVAPDGQEGIAQ